MCGFNRETAALTSMKLIIESKVMGESTNAVFKLLTISCISALLYGTLVYSSRYITANNLAMLSDSVRPST